MANTLSVTVATSGVVGNGRIGVNFSKTNYYSGDTGIVNQQVITSTPAAIIIPASIAVVGVIAIQNKDNTESVFLGTGGGDYPIYLSPATLTANGGVSVFEVAPGEVVYAKTTSGSAIVEVHIHERLPTTTTTTTAVPTTTTTTTAAATTTTTTT